MNRKAHVNNRLWSSSFIFLLLIELFLQFGLYITRPIIANYAVELGANMALAGFFSGLLATVALLTRPFSGYFSDVFSKKKLLVISSALFSISACGCACARHLAPIGIFISIQGLAFAFKSTVVISMVKHVVPASKIGQGVGWMGVAYTISCALGPGIGSYLSRNFGYSFIFWVSFALLCAGFILACLYRPTTLYGAMSEKAGVKKIEKAIEDDGDIQATHVAHIDETAKSSFSLKKLIYIPALLYSAVACFLMVTQGTLASFILLIGQAKGIEGCAIYFAIYSLSTLCARPLSGKLSDTYGFKVVVLPMLVLAAFSPLCLAFSNSILGIILSGACMGIGQGSAYASLQAESVRHASNEELGRASNTFFIGPDIGMGLGPIISGWLFENFGINALCAFCTTTVIFAFLLLLFKRGFHK